MKLTQSWYATGDELVLKMTLEVEGETLQVASMQSTRGYEPQPPASYTERTMRRNLMRALETRIFGDSK
jgi:hypothetical protein